MVRAVALFSSAGICEVKVEQARSSLARTSMASEPTVPGQSAVRFRSRSWSG